MNLYRITYYNSEYRNETKEVYVLALNEKIAKDKAYEYFENNVLYFYRFQNCEFTASGNDDERALFDAKLI